MLSWAEGRLRSGVGTESSMREVADNPFPPVVGGAFAVARAGRRSRTGYCPVMIYRPGRVKLRHQALPTRRRHTPRVERTPGRDGNVRSVTRNATSCRHIRLCIAAPVPARTGPLPGGRHALSSLPVLKASAVAILATHMPVVA